VTRNWLLLASMTGWAAVIAIACGVNPVAAIAIALFIVTLAAARAHDRAAFARTLRARAGQARAARAGDMEALIEATREPRARFGDWDTRELSR
jgi:hypothetical protein